MSIHKNVTAKQLEANRNNANKSTGPKTTGGKMKSRLNSIKDGILASKVLVTGGLGKEDARQFQNLMNAQRDEWQPVGPMEELYVEQIVVCIWRLGRVFRAEAGSIEKNSQDIEDEIAFVEALQAQDAGGALTATATGLDYLVTLLYRAKTELDESGSISPDRLKKLEEHFGSELASKITPLNNGLKNSRGHSDEAAMTLRKESHRVIEYYLDEVRDPLFTKFLVLNRPHRIKRQIGSLTGSIPNTHELDRILRYENNIQRELDRATINLERLQRRRKGESVAPPVKVSMAE